METIEMYLHNLYRERPDFVYSVSRDFAKSCETPMLVLPDDLTRPPMVTSVDVASLCPNAEITVFPWKDPPELKARTINRARNFLKRHVPAQAPRYGGVYAGRSRLFRSSGEGGAFGARRGNPAAH